MRRDERLHDDRPCDEDDKIKRRGQKDLTQHENRYDKEH
jgi:hypothetical protein